MLAASLNCRVGIFRPDTHLEGQDPTTGNLVPLVDNVPAGIEVSGTQDDEKEWVGILVQTTHTLRCEIADPALHPVSGDCVKIESVAYRKSWLHQIEPFWLEVTSVDPQGPVLRVQLKQLSAEVDV